MWLAILGLIGKVFDFLNPWSPYWVNKLQTKDKNKADAQTRLNADAKKGDFDAFRDDLADRDNP